MAPATASAFVDGRIIHNAGTVLRLDPDDEEDEDERRREVEQAAEREIQEGLREQLDAIMGEGPSGGGGAVALVDEASHRLAQSGGRVRLALERALASGSDLGVRLVARQTDLLGVAFNYRLVNVLAQQWARDYSYELITGINETSMRRVQGLLAQWVAEPTTLGALRDELTPIFGSVRAQLIATTEVTRAYAEGAIRSYTAAGFAEGRPEVPIPQHPTCRCFYSLEILPDGTAYWIYNTARDDEVCPICRPYHLERVGLAKRGR